MICGGPSRAGGYSARGRRGSTARARPPGHRARLSPAAGLGSPHPPAGDEADDLAARPPARSRCRPGMVTASSAGAVHAGQSHAVLGDRGHRLPQALQLRQVVLAQADEHAVVAVIEDELLGQLGALFEPTFERLPARRFSTKSASSVRKAAALARVASLAWPIANSSSNWSKTKTGRTGRPSAVRSCKLRRWKCSQSGLAGLRSSAASGRPPTSPMARVTAAMTCSARGGAEAEWSRRIGTGRYPSARSRGNRPAWRSDDLPSPDWPKSTVRTRAATRRRSSSASSSRPWKKVLGASVNATRPGQGFCRRRRSRRTSRSGARDSRESASPRMTDASGPSTIARSSVTKIGVTRPPGSQV